jgi:hypothetical protein
MQDIYTKKGNKSNPKKNINNVKVLYEFKI